MKKMSKNSKNTKKIIILGEIFFNYYTDNEYTDEKTLEIKPIWVLFKSIKPLIPKILLIPKNLYEKTGWTMEIRGKFNPNLCGENMNFREAAAHIKFNAVENEDKSFVAQGWIDSGNKVAILDCYSQFKDFYSKLI